MLMDKQKKRVRVFCLLFPLFATTNQQKPPESRKCKVASQSTGATTRKKFTWRWLALFSVHAVAFSHRGFLRVE
jgi:hypothetical protein